MIIREKELRVGSQFVLRRFQNGDIASFQLELRTVDKPMDGPDPSGDELKAVMEKCLREAVEMTRSVEGVSLRHEDVRAMCRCLFIARTRGC